MLRPDDRWSIVSLDYEPELVDCYVDLRPSANSVAYCTQFEHGRQGNVKIRGASVALPSGRPQPEFVHGYHGFVLDALFLGIVIVFFVLAVAFVRGCVRLLGSADGEARR